MNLVELLIIRPFCKKNKDIALKKIKELISAPKNKEYSLVFLDRRDYENDIAILVFNKNHQQQHLFSIVALSMAEYFSQFGWVDHSTWEVFGEKRATNLELFLRED